MDLQPLPWPRRELTLFACLAAALAAQPSGNAIAVGLGMPISSPVLGQPLRIEIPLLLGSEERTPTNDCVRLSKTADAIEQQFFPRQARVAIEGGSSPRVVIASPLPVREPLVEFRITIGCSQSFARDFLVLTSPPDPVRLTTPQPSPHASAPAAMSQSPTSVTPAPLSRELVAPRAPASAPESSAAPTRSGQTLRVSRDTTLNILARLRYPSSQATRDDYRRLMAHANPELFAGAVRVGSVPIPAGTVLRVPDNLPPPEPKAEPTAPMPVTPAPESLPPTKGKSAGPATGNSALRKDRLVIGGGDVIPGRPLTPRELASAMDRMERKVDDQGRADVEIIDNLKTLNNAFIELKDYNRSLESRLKQMDIEQKSLRSLLESHGNRSLGLFELLALIVASGGIGAALLALHHRLQMKRQRALADLASPPELQPEQPTTRTPRPPPPSPSSQAVPPTPLASAPTTPRPPVSEPVATAIATPEPAWPPAAPPSSPKRIAQELGNGFELELDVMRPQAPEHDSPLEFEWPQAASPASETITPEALAPKNLPVAANSDAAIELADIMASMGLGHEAVRNLVTHLMEDPKRDLGPWLKALEMYRKNGQREEYEWLAHTLRQHLNVQPMGWNDPRDLDRSLEFFPHLMQKVLQLWPSLECLDYLTELLKDNREGTRQGFPQTAAEDILLLQRVLREVQASL